MKSIKYLLVISLVIFLVGCNDNKDSKSITKENYANLNAILEEEGVDIEDMYEITANKNYPIASIELMTGEVIEIELNPDQAPNTVNNFIALANSGFYDGLNFHRVISNFMIQGGDPAGDGTGGPGYSIAGEFSSNGHENSLTNRIGTIAMARSMEKDSAGSQFFINVNDNTHLDSEYAVFGNVISGYKYAYAISQVDTDSTDKPYDLVVIKTITIDTKGIDYDDPQKM